MRATLALLEKITLCPGEIGPDDLEATYKAGVSVSAILDATYVCVGFNIVTRIANALGFRVPPEQLLVRAARLLRIFGYRRLSGFWTMGRSNTEKTAKRVLGTNGAEQNSVSMNGHLFDPYAKKMERLRYAVVSGRGSLDAHVRQAISEGSYGSTSLGDFAQKVSEQAFLVSDDDIVALHRDHYSDDQIFEAAVSAALGAGLYRLERVTTILRAHPPAVKAHSVVHALTAK